MQERTRLRNNGSSNTEDGIWIRPGLLLPRLYTPDTPNQRYRPLLGRQEFDGTSRHKNPFDCGTFTLVSCGHWTGNRVVHPVKIYARMKVGQLTWHTVRRRNRNDVPTDGTITTIVIMFLWVQEYGKQFREGE